MQLSSLELALRAGTVAVLLLLAASLYGEFRNVLAGRLAVAFALGSAAHAASYSLGAPAEVSVWHAPLIALSTGNVVVFWLFARALFDEDFRLRWYHGLIWAAVSARTMKASVIRFDATTDSQAYPDGAIQRQLTRLKPAKKLN